MSVKVRLARLERAAGVGQMCLGCKRGLILYSDTIRHTRPEDLVVRPCDACGFPSFTIIGGYSERELALLRGLFFSPDASPPRTLAERQRHYAAQLYYYILPRTHEIRKIGEREEGRLRGLSVRSESARAQLKVLDEWKAREEDAKAARRLKLSEEEEAAREERRAKAAPTMAVIERVKAAHTSAGRSPKRPAERLYYLQLMAELEVLVYGETLWETQAKIETLRREEQEKQEREEREARERSERLERERLEREERYRREREQRERERLERERARLQAAAPVGTPKKESGAWLRDYKPEEPAPASRFRNPDVTVPRNPMVFDPEAAHVPDAYDPNHRDAVQFQRSTPPDPTRGLTVDDVEAHQERVRNAVRYYRGEYYDGDRRY